MSYRQRGRADRARESNSVGTTVAFYHDPVEAHHAGAVVTARIEPGRRAAQHRSGDRTGEAVEPGRPELLTHPIRDQPRDPLHGLERDVAGEAVGDDDVDVAGEDVVAFHEAHVVEPAAREQGLGRLHQLVSLHVLLADVEKTDARVRHAVHVAGDDGSHGGELAQLLRSRRGVGAQIQHVGVSVRGGYRLDYGVALHAGEGP